ncbi:General transcription factor 3C polypeptide 3 [Trichinella nelsoni]|uniref:General transcription factor 3C polypeptide 3 n=1 Tax=Trichinella nelsoni TaxID=6336 RepID=A0A0V0SB60_9BILA|nr:General transcription factor 3C polypeptide 3 [Trichinella nelsoni]
MQNTECSNEDTMDAFDGEDYLEFLSTETSDMVSDLINEYSRVKVSDNSAERMSDFDEDVNDTISEDDVTPDDDSDEDYISETAYQSKRRKKKKTVRRRKLKNSRGKKTSKSTTVQQPKAKYYRRHLPEQLQSILGHASLCFANGEVKKAITLCKDVIREKPKLHDAYELLSVFYGDLGNRTKCFHHAMAAAMLNRATDASRWKELAETATELGFHSQAVLCLKNAINLEPMNWALYDAKNKVHALLQEPRKVLETELAAVKGMLNSEEMTYDHYLQYTESIYRKCKAENDQKGAQLCLKYYLLKLKSADKICYEKLNNYIVMLIAAKDFENIINDRKAHRSWTLFAMRLHMRDCASKQAKRSWAVHEFSPLKMFLRKCEVKNFEIGKVKSITVDRVDIPDDFSPEILARVILAWLNLKHYNNALVFLQCLEDHYPMSMKYRDAYLLVMDTYFFVHHYSQAVEIAERLVQVCGPDDVEVQLKYADFLIAINETNQALEIYERTMEKQPTQPLARLKLATLLQKLGRVEEAMEVLELFDKRGVDELGALDAELLYEQCQILGRKQLWSQYFISGKHLMAMYFKEIHSQKCFAQIRNSYISRSANFRTCVLNTVANSPLKKLVNRVPEVGKFAKKLITGKQLWSVFDKYEELLHLTAFASQSMLLLKAGYLKKIDSRLLLAAVQCRNVNVIWNVFRYCVAVVDENYYWNLLGMIFTMTQDVCYNRYILRQIALSPDCVPLAWINGNNSLVAGSHQHALVEYFYVQLSHPDIPLINLLEGLSLLHMGSRRLMLRAQDSSIQALAVLSRYKCLRGDCQEVYYNFGRAMQQLGIIHLAICYYRKVLQMEPEVKMTNNANEGEYFLSNPFDLRPLAAFNLSVIYFQSGNEMAALSLYNKYLPEPVVVILSLKFVENVAIMRTLSILFLLLFITVEAFPRTKRQMPFEGIGPEIPPPPPPPNEGFNNPQMQFEGGPGPAIPNQFNEGFQQPFVNPNFGNPVIEGGLI